MTKKVYHDDKSEMTVNFTDDNKFIFEINDVTEPDSVHYYQCVQLTKEDVEELINDLQYYLDNQNPLPKFKGISEDKVKEAWVSSHPYRNSAPSGIQFHNKEHYEAYLQAQSKRLAEESMKEYIASIKPTQHIVDKELKTIELDALNREVQITKTKLKQNGKKRI